MQAKTYGIFDGVQQEYVLTFNAKNDDDAKRIAKYQVRAKGFDDIGGRDKTIHYIYTLDTANGLIVDNSPHPVCNLATFIDERKAEELHNQVQEKLASDEFFANLKDELASQLRKEVLKDVKQYKFAD